MLRLLLILFITTPMMAESWNYVSRNEFKGESTYGWVFGVEIYNDKIIINDKGGLTSWSEDSIVDFYKSGGILSSWNNSLYVSGGALSKYSNGEWKKYKFDDRLDSRSIKKSLPYNNKMYSLSRALAIKSIDTINGAIQTMVDTSFSELLVLDNNKLNLIFQKDDGIFNAIEDMFIDKDGTFWFAASTKKEGGLVKYKDDKMESIDIASYIKSDMPLFSNITGSDEFIYLTNEKVYGGEIHYPPQFLRYNKQNGDIDVYDFPEYIGKTRFDQVRKLEYIDGKVYIASNAGIFVFENEEIKYLDIFADFLDEIVDDTSELQLEYLEASDFDIDGNKFYIATSVGLIYSDDFATGIESNEQESSKIDVYPNVLENGKNTVTLDPQNIGYNISDIQIYSTGGELVSNVNNFPPNLTEKRQIKLPDLSSGAYFLIIQSDGGDFLAPIIIKN